MHFTTSTTVGWIDFFSRQIYREILIDSLKWCQENKGLHICAYVIMTNHLHMVAYTDKIPLEEVLKSFKKFTAARILEAVNDPSESRSEWIKWLLKWFGSHVRQENQIWQHGNHPIALWSQKVTGQKVSYIHNNPLRAGWVGDPTHWRYSSAGAYAGLNRPELLEVEVIDAWGLGKS